MLEPGGLVIFDCDGVLVESEKLALEINVEMLADIGWPLSREEICERFMGRPYAHMLKVISEQVGYRVPDEWVARWDGAYRRRVAEDLEPVAGVAQAIDALERDGYATCVASSSGPESLQEKLTVTGLHDRLAGRIFSSVEVAHPKPAPDLFLHAAARLGFTPERCVVVEDSRYGVQAARAAGMPVFAFVAGQMTPLSALEGPGTTIFAAMSELPGLIRGT